MSAHGGNITLADLKNYQAVERTPLRGKYRGYEIVLMPPPSSGSIAILQMLRMIEPFDVAAMGSNSAAKYHLFAEVMKRAFRDRAEYLGDPAFTRVPVSQLLDPAYIKGRMADFSPIGRPQPPPSSRDLANLRPAPLRNPPRPPIFPSSMQPAMPSAIPTL